MAPNYDDLRASIKTGEVILPADPGYTESLARWSATCVRQAAVVVRVKSAEEASAAVRFATANGIPLAVRGGGHNTSGESAIEDGLVVDLSLMRSATVDEKAQTVTFDGGCIWEDVDNALYAKGLATVGGTVSHTGVGGLILGGGYGMLTGEHGMSVDNLIECEVVLANGDIVKASKGENPDLFWALCGAGNSFGVVTSFTMQGHPQGEAWGGVVIWPTLDVMPTIVEFANKLIETTNGKQWFLPMLITDPASGTKMMGATMFHNGSKEEGEALYKPLLDLQPVAMNHTGVVPFPVVNTFANPMAPHMDRYLFGGANFVAPLTVELVQEAADVFYDGVLKEGNEELRGSMMGFEIIPQEKIKSVPVDATAFAGRGGTGYQTMILMHWKTADKDEEAKATSMSVAKVFKEKGGSKTKAEEERTQVYFNYLSGGLEEERILMRTGRLFGPNTDRLKELKAKYDPTNVFKKRVNLSS